MNRPARHGGMSDVQGRQFPGFGTVQAPARRMGIYQQRDWRFAIGLDGVGVMACPIPTRRSAASHVVNGAGI